MRIHRLLIALALLFGARAFAQEWEWNFTPPYVYSTFSDLCELSDGRIVVIGNFREADPCDIWRQHFPALVLLDSDGTELATAQYPKEGYFGETPFMLEDGQGGLYMLVTYSPDHDTCSPNYFHNFAPPIDHAILGLYRLNDDLTIAESHEIEIPVDTSEWRSPDNPWLTMSCGQARLYGAFIDDDGSIVGACYKSVTFDLEKPRGHDSTCFFRMDFDGNLLKWKSHVGLTRSGAFGLYGRNHLIKADSLYLHYGKTDDIVGNGDNLAYLDRDFNIVRSRKFRHSPDINPVPPSRFSFGNQNVIRNHFGKTYMTAVVDEFNYDDCCVLYEFDDDFNGNDTVLDNDTMVPIARYIDRKTTGKDAPTYNSCIGMVNDDFFYFAYTLNDNSGVGDSWIVIEYLTRFFATWETLYYGAEGDRVNHSARSIKATADGGLLLLTHTAEGFPNEEYGCVVTKFTNPVLGVEEAHKNGFKLAIAYPNPGTSELNIRTGLRNARVEVYDAAGRLVHSQEITEEVTPIGTEAWPSGIYVWKVYKGNAETETGKWVKE